MKTKTNMLIDLGQKDGEDIIWTYNVPDVGQNWRADILKCAHTECSAKFKAYYPDDILSVNCPNCGRDTRINRVFDRRIEYNDYEFEDDGPASTPISNWIN